MKKLLFILILSLFSLAFAQEDDGTTESWYTYWGIGYANNTYPSELQVVLDLLEDADGVGHTSLSLDIFGFYRHITPKTIGGFVINGAADRYSVDDDWMQLNSYLYSLSVMHYPGQYFGSGPFLRSDVGLAKMVVNDSDDDSATSDNGIGILLGGGWSFDLGGTRILINGNYSIKKVEDETVKTFGISVGGLF